MLKNNSVREVDRNALRPLAGKYIWWKTPDEALALPDRVIAQVMNIGDYEDVQELTDMVGDAVLREVLYHAEIGQFDERSWIYWHYRLGNDSNTKIPQMPVRRLE